MIRNNYINTCTSPPQLSPSGSITTQAPHNKGAIKQPTSAPAQAPSAPKSHRNTSPKIFDLLNNKKKEGENESESESEKEVAELSDEKLIEDLEVGNLSVELLQRLEQCNYELFAKLQLTSCHDDNEEPPAGYRGDEQPTSSLETETETTNAGNSDIKTVQDEIEKFLEFVVNHDDYDEIINNYSMDDINDDKYSLKETSTTATDCEKVDDVYNHEKREMDERFQLPTSHLLESHSPPQTLPPSNHRRHRSHDLTTRHAFTDYDDDDGGDQSGGTEGAVGGAYYDDMDADWSTCSSGARPKRNHHGAGNSKYF